MQPVNFFIPEYHETYYMLTDYPVYGLFRELTTDINELINYVLAHVVEPTTTPTGFSTSSVEYSFPVFLSNTLNYIVTSRAEQGGTFDVKTMLDVKKQVNDLAIDYVRQLSEHPYWFNHHLQYINGVIGGVQVISPSCCVVVAYGEAKLTNDRDYGMSRTLGPQILSAIQMLVMRL